MTDPNKPSTPFDDYRRRRAEGQARLLETDHLGIKRFLNLDTAAYRDATDEGRLDDRTRELLGLVASTVLRCNDCIDYHLERCVELNWTDKEIEDALNVALIVGGSIVIPHLRHARATLDQLFAEKSSA